MRRSPAALALYALVTAFLVGGTTAFVGLNKSVTVSVDGKSRKVHSFGKTVEDVLHNAGVETGPRDFVVPGPDQPVTHDSHVIVRHARQLQLQVDGKTTTRWVTALTVNEALDQLRVRAEGAYLSASRSHRLPRDGFSLDVRLPRKITIAIGEARLKTRTAAATVREALADAGIKLGENDKVDVDLDQRPWNGMTVQIVQYAGDPKVERVSVPYETIRRGNPNMPIGQEKVVQEGQEGLRKLVIAMVIGDGGAKHRKVLAHTMVREPVDQVVEYGTDSDSPEVAEVADLNWEALAECESGGDPNAVNPAGPYYGLYQFDETTWQGVGGEGVPTDWPAEEQTYRAQLLYQDRGASPWPVCGDELFS